MQKKNKSENHIVYSTNPQFLYSQDNQAEEKTVSAEKQKLYVYYETKGRRGKQVTIITGLKGRTEDLEILAKKIKIHCGTGGSVKEKEIIIQGNFVDTIKTFLKKDNYSVK
ncbi:MAG: translation initiation factor [Chitinophagaceae bacterium]|nr:translation initiation factor [Chitinophagaceae bacterium]